MSRLAVFSVFLLFVVQAQAQMFSHGIPAGANSPEPDGRQHGIPSSVLSPTPIPPGVNVPGINVPSQRFFFNGPVHRFGNPHRREKVIVPVPIFYPAYSYGEAGYPADPSIQPSSEQAGNSGHSSSSAAAAEQSQPAASDEMLRQAYLQGARDALKDTLERERNGRYGDHYLDSREQERSRASQPAQDGSSEEAAPVPSSPARKDDSGPATVFIFKDGHQLESRNFAIMGDTLYDFSTSVLKKVQLGDLDKDKTIQANEDRGITVKLP